MGAIEWKNCHQHTSFHCFPYIKKYHNKTTTKKRRNLINLNTRCLMCGVHLHAPFKIILLVHALAMHSAQVVFFLMHMPERMFIGVDAIYHCAIHSQICPRYVLYGSGLIWATSLPQSSAEKNADLLDHRNHSKWFVQNLPVQSLFLMLIQIYYDAVCWIFSPPSCGVAFNRSANIVPTEAMIIKSLSKCK